MFIPSINILRADVSSTQPLHDAFAHFLIRVQLADESSRPHLNKRFSEARIAHAVLVSESVGATRLYGIKSEANPDFSGILAQNPLLSVVLVENISDEAEKQAELVSQFAAKLTDIPWSPEVIVACLDNKDSAVAALASTLEGHFSGATIRFVNVLPNNEMPEAFWWWRYHKMRVAVLPSSGENPTKGLQKALDAVREAGIVDAGEAPLMCTETQFFESAKSYLNVGLLVLDLQDSWCFEENPTATDRQKGKGQVERHGFLTLLKGLMKKVHVGPEHVRIVVSRTHAKKKIHPDIEAELGTAPKTLTDSVFSPLSEQLSQITAEQRHALSVLMPVRLETPKIAETVSETMLTALAGRRRVLDHRIALQEARGGGDIATRLDALFEAGHKEVVRIVDHSIETMAQRLRAGAYPGADNKELGVGSRDGPRWDKHFPLSSHIWDTWSRKGQAGDGGRNWVVATSEPVGPMDRIMDPKRTLEAHDRIKEKIAQAVSRDCAAGLARLALTTDLYFETVIRGESRAMLRELASVTSKSPTQSKNEEFLPSGAHGATGLAGRRAADAVKPETLLQRVLIWPSIKKVSHHLSIKRNLKSLSLLMRQAGKLAGAVVVVAVMLNQPIGFPDKEFIEEIGGPNADIFLYAAVLVGVLLTVYVSVKSHFALLAEKLDKLRDDTHKVLEDAAVRQLAAARKIILDVVADDLAALRSDLAAAIQARDGKVLKTLNVERQALDERIAHHGPKVKKRKDGAAQAQKEERSRRDKSVSALKKVFALEALQ